MSDSSFITSVLIASWKFIALYQNVVDSIVCISLLLSFYSALNNSQQTVLHHVVLVHSGDCIYEVPLCLTSVSTFLGFTILTDVNLRKMLAVNRKEFESSVFSCLQYTSCRIEGTINTIGIKKGWESANCMAPLQVVTVGATIFIRVLDVNAFFWCACMRCLQVKERI